MKKFFSLLILIPVIALSQNKSYVQIGPTGYIGKNSNGIGILTGFGISKGITGVGFSCEAVSLEKNWIIPLHFDIRFYLDKKMNAPYITVQPGYNFRNVNHNNNYGLSVHESGGIYLAAGVGFLSLPKRPGFTVQLKYTLMGNSINTEDPYHSKTKKTSMVGSIGFGLFLVI